MPDNQEPRKATDVLLDLETKFDTLLDTVRGAVLNIQIVSNKINDLVVKVASIERAIATVQTMQQAKSITVEAVQKPPPMPIVAKQPVDPERHIMITANNVLPQTNEPQGFRRTSRPETYAGDNAILPRVEKKPDPPQEIRLPPPKKPPQPMQQPMQQVQAPQSDEVEFPDATPEDPSQGQVPTTQRCVDKNGKSIFLANVEIVEKVSGKTHAKTRTNGMGKWSASLPIGLYRVSITHKGSSINGALSAVQDVEVKGDKPVLELPVLIIK